MSKYSVCHAPYLRNHTPCDCCLWYISVKWYLPALFFIVSKFWFFRLLRGSKGNKWPKMVKNSVMTCISGTLHHIIFIFGTHLKKDNITRHLLHFLQILIFGVNSWEKSIKNDPNDKKLCLSHSISQEAYIIWSWFLVHMYKMMTSADAFLIFFSKFSFSRFLMGLKGNKLAQKDCDCGFWCTYVKWWYIQNFFSFFQSSDFLSF